MKILYIINGLGFSNNTGIGGSDKRAIEIIRKLQKVYPKDSFDILTTESGYELFTKKEDLNTNYFVIYRPFWWPKELNKSLIGRVLSYFYITFISFFKINDFKDYDIFFPTSDFFFDLIPAFTYKSYFKKILLCMIHHQIKNPVKRNGSFIINTLMYMSQRFSLKFISDNSDYLFVYDTPEGNNIKKLLLKSKLKKIFSVKNGIDTNFIDSIPQPKKIYDACFLGGIRYSKGIKEFVLIWKEIVKKYKDAKFVVIGGGSEEIVSNLKQEIKENKLTNNIILTGPLSGDKLYAAIKSSRLFLFPSHEEGWGIALCEAMYCKLPVICYDLPAYKIFGNDLDKIKIGNWQMLANHVIKYLDNKKEIKVKGEELKNIASKYSWQEIAKEEMVIYKKIIKFSS
ncbi:hypothetical protein A2V49_02310 [candidate division WWE3 bacterium RBG_19FT_COMBO_34_6]|uniref:Glycosyl transferase family 1 domain-containing protein n=1 Tax=candidate division WWE3 bacterium RBG_19FT_COMBO_34_6 TaxID=1802612 RepID=A0A1F4UJH7_UNCKA|nr:MAG: hypothetical protein A2V49_02310 [candidate division WWE3 bacterium RBG_19FT_COMBO_34_6]